MSSAAGADERTVAPSACGAVGAAAIDFHSAEFNRIDDLNDTSGNYRDFQNLDGMITADMRHRNERHREEGARDTIAEAAPPPPRMRTQKEQGAETAELSGPLEVISRGRTLIVDTDFKRADACAGRLGDRGLMCTVIVTAASSRPDMPEARDGGTVLLEADSVSISGTFGAFAARMTLDGRERSLSEESGDEAAFDLVLDLQASPSFAGSLLPTGYYAPGANPAALAEAIDELPEMKGRFEKPRLVNFQKNLCFHGRSRSRDCRLCLDLCPFAAIQSKDRALSIDHRRCEGCGGCAVICPAGAIAVIEPSSEDLLNILRSSMEDHSSASVSRRSLVISDMKGAGLRGLPVPERDVQDVFLCEVDQIACVGLEMMLAALACGAGRVVVLCGPQTPSEIGNLLQNQARMAEAILRGLGMPGNAIRVVASPPGGDDDGKGLFSHAGPDMRDTALRPMTLPCAADKRAIVRLAVRHLRDISGAGPREIPLPDGSPFGAVAVSAGCTLCMACASVCPTGALSAGGDVPRLLFQEFLCHQCGLCKEACPEGSIRLEPRIRPDADSAEAPTVLRRAEPTRCMECGLTFGSQAMVDRMQEKLAGHWMYQSERQLRRLRMCRVCRTRDAILSHERTSRNQP